jgi:hypothetical protein
MDRDGCILVLLSQGKQFFCVFNVMPAHLVGESEGQQQPILEEYSVWSLNLNYCAIPY